MSGALQPSPVFTPFYTGPVREGGGANTLAVRPLSRFPRLPLPISGQLAVGTKLSGRQSQQ